MSRKTLVCLAALSRGHLVRQHNQWRFAGRLFGSATVNKLILPASRFGTATS